MNLNHLKNVRQKMLPLGLMLTMSLLLAGGLFWLSQGTAASAAPSDYSLALSTYPTIVGSPIDSCSLCHSSVPSLNPFGSAYKSGGRGKATSLTNIANLDSDNDGFSNLVEINAHTFPGDPLDFPATQPTATNTPTNTPVTPPTATNTPVTPPTATNTPVTPPTATKTPVTQPTATKTPVTPPTVTNTPMVSPTNTKPAPTATQMGPTATKNPKMTSTPEVKPTKVKKCIKDDSDYRKREKEREHRGGKPRPITCPRGSHEHDDRLDGEHSWILASPKF